MAMARAIPDLRVRPARLDDRPYVLAAARRLADFEPPGWRTREELIEGESRTLRAFFQAPPEGSALFVAQAGNAPPVGFVFLETLHDYFTRQEHGHIGILAVASEGEGRGVGGALLRTAEDWARARGFRRLTLAVFEGNRHARAVYEHLGYAPEVLRYVKTLEPS